MHVSFFFFPQKPHENLIMLKGYSTNPISIIMKYVQFGDLLEFIKKNPNVEFKQVKKNKQT